eukprot:EG_transcript_2624
MSGSPLFWAISAVVCAAFASFRRATDQCRTTNAGQQVQLPSNLRYVTDVVLPPQHWLSFSGFRLSRRATLRLFATPRSSYGRASRNVAQDDIRVSTNNVIDDLFDVDDDDDDDDDIEPASNTKTWTSSLSSSSGEPKTVGTSFFEREEIRHFEGIFQVVDTTNNKFIACRWQELRNNIPEGQLYPVSPRAVVRLERGSIFVAKTIDIEGVKPFVQLEREPCEGTLIGVVLVEGGRVVFQAQDKNLRKPLPVVTEDPVRYIGHYVECRRWEVGLGLFPNGVVDVVEDLGPVESVTNFVIQSFKLPTAFPPEVLQLTEGMTVPPLGNRVDVRSVPLVTIDGVDSRDFDDAVWAETDGDPENPGGWHIMVAIADVSHYVQPNDSLDIEAFVRGNSVYFPDRCIPMLPEKLSNDLCSLRPLEDRACIGVHVWINSEGQKLRYQFFRGLMRSAARLTYDQVEDFLRGEPTNLSPAIQERVIALHGAYRSLNVTRTARNPLEIIAPEVKVVFGADGKVVDVRNKVPLESEAIIEEFMILANICAAEFLQAQSLPCPFRVHEEPTVDKIRLLRDFMESQGIESESEFDSALDFNRLLQLVKFEAAGADSIMQSMVLRSQTKARYSPENTGHFGLNLKDYCHFTSPIRRYADLLVHRLLSDAIDGTQYNEEIAGRLQEACDYISEREIDSMNAERDSVERFATLYFKSQVGKEFPAFISGISRAGLFVTLENINLCGLIPMERLPSDFYVEYQAPLRLEGSETGLRFALGDMVQVAVAASDLAKGKLTMTLGRQMTARLAALVGRPLRTGGRRAAGGRKRTLQEDAGRGRPVGKRRRRA